MNDIGKQDSIRGTDRCQVQRVLVDDEGRILSVFQRVDDHFVMAQRIPLQDSSENLRETMLIAVFMMHATYKLPEHILFAGQGDLTVILVIGKNQQTEILIADDIGESLNMNFYLTIHDFSLDDEA